MDLKGICLGMHTGRIRDMGREMFVWQLLFCALFLFVLSPELLCNDCCSAIITYPLHVGRLLITVLSF